MIHPRAVYKRRSLGSKTRGFKAKRWGKRHIMQTNPKAEVAALPPATGASDPATRSVPKTTEHNADAWTRTFSAALCAQPRGGSHPSGQHLNGEAKRAPSPRCRGQDESRPRYDVDEPRKHEAEGKDPGAKQFRLEMLVAAASPPAWTWGSCPPPPGRGAAAGSAQTQQLDC